MRQPTSSRSTWPTTATDSATPRSRSASPPGGAAGGGGHEPGRRHRPRPARAAQRQFLRNPRRDWFFLVSTGTPSAGSVSTLNHAFNQTPFSNDRLFTFGDSFSLPIVGNFDLPVSP